MVNIVKIILFFTAIILTYFSIKVIRDYPDSDKKIKNIYFDVVHELKDIEKAQLYYKYKKGNFTDNYDSLNNFIQKDSIFLPKDSMEIRKVSDLLFADRKVKPLGKVIMENNEVLLHMRVDTIKKRKDSTTIKDTKLSLWAKKSELLMGFDKEIIDRERINSHNNGVLADSISLILNGNLEKTQVETNWPTSYEVMYKNK